MDMQDQISQTINDPSGLEQLYQRVLRQKIEAEFTQAIQAAYTEAPDNMLLAAWHYRLQTAIEVTRHILWKFAVPPAFLCGLLLWFLSDDDFTFIDRIPLFIVVAAPIAAVAALAFLSIASQRSYRLAFTLAVSLLVLTLYILLIVPTMVTWAQSPAANLMLIHLPVLSLAAVGIFLTGWRSHPEQRFAFVIKTYEVVTTGGLFAVAILIFFMVTYGLFNALNIELPTLIQRLIWAGGGGMLPVLIVAITYNPLAPQKNKTSARA
jgi:hypothetical protein